MKRTVHTASLLLLTALVVSACAPDLPTPEAKQQTVDPKSESSGISEAQIESIPTDSLVDITETIETEEPVLYIPDQYYDVIDSIVEYVNTFDADVLGTYIGMDDISGIGEICFNENPLELITFSFVDIDDDKIAELFVLANEEYATSNRILEMYTFYDGEVHHLLSGWARNRYYLLSDMTFYNEGSGGAAYSIWSHYNYDWIEHKLSFIDSYFTVDGFDVDPDYEQIFLCYTTDKNLIFSTSDGVNIIGPCADNQDIIDNYYANDISSFYEYENLITLAEYCS